MQRHRDQEMRKRRKEAEQLLHGWRAYGDDASSVGGFSAWASPRARRTGRASFGDILSDSLTDPSMLEKRRQSTMPRLQHNWGEDETVDGREEREQPAITPLGADRTKFLFERQHYDGTNYPKFDDRTAYHNGRALFKDDVSQITEFEGRDPGASFSRARFIDTTGSQNRLREASDRSRRSLDGKSQYSVDSGREKFEKGRYSVESGRDGPDTRRQSGDTSAFNDVDSDVPETVWRDFISPGK